MRRALLLLSVLLVSTAAHAADVIRDVRPSRFQSDYGPVSQAEVSTPYLIPLEPNSLAFHSPAALLHLRFPETVWIIAYETEIYDAEGKAPRENYLCHTFLGDTQVEQLEDHAGHALANEMRVVFSDAYTRGIRLPEGAGIRIAPENDVRWMPMFNNRGDDVARVGMRGTVHFIREADLKKPLKPLYSILEAVQTPHLFFVPSGRHEQARTFQLDFEGRIHFMGTHIHPYAESMALYNVTRDELVWKGSAQNNAAGETSDMEVFSSIEGYPVHAGETYKFVSTYNNPTEDFIDAMAGIFIFYSRERSHH
jgi:hypothetical protein